MSDTHTKAVAVIERGGEDGRIHPLVRMMRESGAVVDTATIGEMMRLQREWEAGEAKRAYTSALVALKRDLPTVIGRDRTVDFKNREGKRTYYTHASLAGVMDAVTESLTAHGFSLGWEPSTDKGQVTVTCRLTHAGGHSEASTISAPIDVSGNKSPAQGVASTITLLQRYTALAILGIATADMKEPQGEADPLAVDSRANLAMVTEIRKAGRNLEDAITVAGLPVKEWRACDLARIAAWLAPVDEREEEVPEAEVVPEAAPEQATIPEPIDARLANAAQALGYKPSEMAELIATSCSKEKALAMLVAEYKAKNPKSK